jgi:hypothetical protein
MVNVYIENCGAKYSSDNNLRCNACGQYQEDPSNVYHAPANQTSANQPEILKIKWINND